MFSRRYFIEYQDADRFHPAGFRLPVDSPVVLLGHDPAALVHFGDEYPMVSQRHAIIRQQGDQYLLEPLSRLNSTYLNSHRIFQPTPLRDGDEIRLASDGPRLRFILPGRTVPPREEHRRRSGVNAWLAALCLILLGAVGVGIWKIAELTSANRRLDELVTKALEQQANDKPTPTPTPEKFSSSPAVRPASSSPAAAPSESAMKAADKSVYYVMARGFEVTTPQGRRYEIRCGNGRGQIPGWTGTGFLLSDGRFVTARHVVEPWYFIQNGTDDRMLTLNILASNGGQVKAFLTAISPTGDEITFSSSDCSVNRAGDTVRRLATGERIIMASEGTRDFATVQSGRSGGLPFSPETSRNLSRGTRLTILSFPLGLGANAYNDINPVYGTATVAADGLQDGMILTTETTYEKGSSGGPVFITDPSGSLVVVGITSAIAGRSTGFIEPIASIR